MNLQTEHIGQVCLPAALADCVLAEYAAAAQSAAKNKASFTDLLETGLKAETDFRADRTGRMLTKLAGFPTVETLEAFDFGFAVGAPKALITEARHAGLRRARRERGSARAEWRRQDTPGDRLRS
jgi:DNA replication protein DnaC